MISLYRADGRQCVWRRVGERFVDVKVVDRVAHGGVGVMVWAGVCYGQWTQVHFIDGILNAQRYGDEILRPIVVPFIHDHHLMLQHDNAWPHVARICIQFLEAENIPVLAWPAYSPDMLPIEQAWDGLDRRIRQRVPVPANIQQLRTAIEEEWTNIPQATFNNLINSMRRRCVSLREANSGHILNGYEKIPPVEETLASYLSMGKTASLKFSSLPSKPLQDTSRLNGKAYAAAGQLVASLHTMAVLQAYAAAGQAVASLHTMAVLQAYQADLQKDLDNGQGLSPDAVAELRRTTVWPSVPPSRLPLLWAGLWQPCW